ncbi:SMI1/KNR4 family protein [Variovorax sp. V116]|uniref:SMI1/KNR4 family protein n=1 Tax=Variovorax sp. V116 TaxID=3065953 RepID=UPI0034E8F9FD
MEHTNRRLIRALWEKRPEDIRSSPANEAKLLEFEAEFGTIPEDFRWFLTECGGGVVGSEWVNDIERLASSHRKYEQERGTGYRRSNMFVIGWDGGGQPFGLDPLTHAVVVEADGEMRQLVSCRRNTFRNPFDLLQD